MVVLARFRELRPGNAVLSVITYGELIYGAEKSQFREQARRQLAELAALIPVMELPIHAGEFYGAIRAALATKGDMIGNNDLWIAAHVMTEGLTLLTNNEREFRPIAHSATTITPEQVRKAGPEAAMTPSLTKTRRAFSCGRSRQWPQQFRI